MSFGWSDLSPTRARAMSASMAACGLVSARALSAHLATGWRSIAIAGGEADEAVLAGQVGPGLGEGSGPVPSRCRVSSLWRSFASAVGATFGGGRGAFAAGVGHAIERGLAAAAADGEIHRAVFLADDRVGERHRLAGDEFLFLGLEARAVRLEVDRPHGAVGPVEREHGALVFRGKLRAGAEDGAGRRAGADVDGAGQRVRIIRRPAAGTGAPAVVAAADDVVDAGGHVPRRAHVPLHVGVVGEELAVGIEGDVVLVAEAAGEELDAFAVRVGFADVAAGGEDAAGVAVGVPQAGDQVVLADGDRAGVVEVFRDFGVVAVGEVDRFAIRAEDDAVGAVFAAAVAFADELGLVELVVAVGVPQAPEALAWPSRCSSDRGCRTRRAARARRRVVCRPWGHLAGSAARPWPRHPSRWRARSPDRSRRIGRR